MSSFVQCLDTFLLLVTLLDIPLTWWSYFKNKIIVANNNNIYNKITSIYIKIHKEAMVSNFSLNLNFLLVILL